MYFDPRRYRNWYHYFACIALASEAIEGLIQRGLWTLLKRQLRSTDAFVVRRIIRISCAGSVSVIRAAAKSGVKRVVLTSSIVALHEVPFAHLPTYTPESWNTTSTVENGAYTAGKVVMHSCLTFLKL
jgi:hypothetical protein